MCDRSSIRAGTDVWVCVCHVYRTRKQGRKSMFKLGGDNIGEKYTSRLRDVGGFGGMPPEDFFKWCNLVRFGVYLDQILSLKNY